MAPAPSAGDDHPPRVGRRRAGTRHEVGGDAFYYTLDDGRLHLAVLDAMGHGLGAAVMAGVARPPTSPRSCGACTRRPRLAGGGRTAPPTSRWAACGGWRTASRSSADCGDSAVNAVLAAVYTGDVLLDAALGLYRPTRWTAKDWTIEIVDKYVQAQATRAVYDPLAQLDPRA